MADQAKNVKSAFGEVIEAESSEEVLHRLLERQNKLDLKEAREKLLKERAMAQQVKDVTKMNKEIDDFNNISMDNGTFAKAKTRLEVLAAFDEDLDNDNTDELSMSDDDETNNTYLDQDDQIEETDDLNLTIEESTNSSIQIIF